MSTTPIPRWDEGGMYDPPYLDDDGDWVLWADHAPALAAMTARAEKAEALFAMESAWATKAEVIVDAAVALWQACKDYVADPTFCTESCYKGAQIRLDTAILAGGPTEGVSP